MSEPTVGTGGDGSVTATAEVAAFDSAVHGGDCAGYYVKNTHATLELKVRVVGMHIDRTAFGGTDGMAILGPGVERLFVWRKNNISRVNVKSATTGTCTYRAYVQARD